VETGLPRLHHPLFEIDDFEQATQQRFLLALMPAGDESAIEPLRSRLERSGAVNIREVPT
jgi:hypothetical protein